MKRPEPTKSELQSEVEALRSRLAEMETFRTQLEKAERLRREARESEQRYRLFVEKFPGIAFRGSLDFVPEFFHGAVEKLTGYTADDFLSRRVKWDELLYPEDLPAVIASAQGHSTAPHHFVEREYRIRCKDGEVRWVRELTQSIYDSDGSFLAAQGVIHDITEQKLTEHALRASEERLDLAILGSKAGVWDLEYTVHEPAGTITAKVFISPAFRRALGYDENEFPNSLEAWREHVVPEDMEKMGAAARDLLDGLIDVHEVEYRARHKDGGIRWIYSCGRIRRYEGGRVIRWSGLNWDITGRKKAEEERKRLAAILERTPDLIGTGDLEGKILYLNQAAKSAVGILKDDDLSTMKICDFYPEWATDIILKEVVPKALATGAWHGEKTAVLTRGGKEMPVSQVVLSHKDSAGNVQYMSTIIRDISRLRATEAALRQSEERYRLLSESLEATVREQLEKLRQAESMAAVGQMISAVAHEVRNPLNTVVLGLDALTELVENDKEKSDICAEIRYGVGALRKIVAELLDYSKPVKLAYSSLSVEKIVNAGLKRIPRKPPHVVISVELGQQDRKVVVDAEKVERVLVNLISNAIDAMSGGGTVKIADDYLQTKGQEMLVLRVSDTGPGMDVETLKRVKEPFFSTKSKGTGLGLAICRKIIDAHGGSLAIHSKLHEGTSVEVILPVELPRL